VQVLGTNKPIEVIHNFYRPREPRKSRNAIRKALGLEKDDFVLIHLSNLRPVKRVPEVLRVVAQLKDNPNIKLLILAGESFDSFKPLVKKLGIGKRVVVKENVLDIENYIAASDCGIYASERESFGMGVLETMSFGKPVVATRVGGIAEIVVDGRTGFLKELGDVKGMARAARKLADDPALAAQIGAAAKSRATECFSADASVRKYESFYRQVLAECML
jgi:glycosyltransferase involved in cell wall biosynthesis